MKIASRCRRSFLCLPETSKCWALLLLGFGNNYFVWCHKCQFYHVHLQHTVLQLRQLPHPAFSSTSASSFHNLHYILTLFASHNSLFPSFPLIYINLYSEEEDNLSYSHLSDQLIRYYQTFSQPWFSFNCISWSLLCIWRTFICPELSFIFAVVCL